MMILVRVYHTGGREKRREEKERKGRKSAFTIYRREEKGGWKEGRIDHLVSEGRIISKGG